MAKATLQQAMDSILADAANTLDSGTTITKEASAPSPRKLDLTNDEIKGLAKLASALRSVNVEPTYQDLYTFVGGLNGRR